MTFPVYKGYGEVKINDRNPMTEWGSAGFFQIEPSALLEFYLTQNNWFNIGAGYRFIGNKNYRIIDQADLSGLTGYLGLKIGVFR